MQQTQGERLQALHASFPELTPTALSRIGGEKLRLAFYNGEQDRGWQSAPMHKKIAKVFGMTVDQLMAYVDGEMLLEDAIRIARPAVEAALAGLGAEKRRRALMGRAFERAQRESDTPLPRSLIEVAVECGGELDTEDRIVDFMLRMSRHIPHAKREAIGPTDRGKTSRR